jgi:hypothetical protein
MLKFIEESNNTSVKRIVDHEEKIKNLNVVTEESLKNIEVRKAPYQEIT